MQNGECNHQKLGGKRTICFGLSGIHCLQSRRDSSACYLNVEDTVRAAVPSLQKCQLRPAHCA